MVNGFNNRFIVLSLFFVLLLSFASAELNLKITANLNGMSADFNAVTEPFADNGFDGSDVPLIFPPSNYISLYSNITLQNGVSKLVLDAWNQSSNPRVLTLTLETSAIQSGQLDLTWTGANNYSIVLNDYAGDSLRRVPITGGSTTLSTTGSGTYSITGFSSDAGGKRYFSLVVTNTSGSTADTTPPGPVVNLAYSYKTKSNIFWVWANPTDSDFNSAIVYADGVNVANTSLGKYNATGLVTNTSHTIRINTKDFAGNVNYLNVSSFTSTSATSGVTNNPVNPLGPGPTTATSPLGPGTGGAGTGTIANTGSSGVGGVGGVGGDGFLAPGDELPENATAAQKIFYRTKNNILDYLARQSKVTLILYAVALISAILLIVYGIKHHKGKSIVHKNNHIKSIVHKKIIKKKKR